MYTKMAMGSNTHKQILEVKNKLKEQEKDNEVVYVNNFISKGGFTLQDVIGDE